MTIDLFRLGVVYLHLLACCVALGTILLSDIEQARMLWNDDHPTPHLEHHLNTLHSTITYSLLALWITGIAICIIDFQSASWHMFANPKLQAKISLVILLTINGRILNTFIFPILKREGHLLHMRLPHALFAIFTGSISAVTWLYAALLGIGRSLSWKYTLFELLWFWPVAVLVAFSTITFLAHRKRQKLGIDN